MHVSIDGVKYVPERVADAVVFRYMRDNGTSFLLKSNTIEGLEQEAVRAAANDSGLLCGPCLTRNGKEVMDFSGLGVDAGNGVLAPRPFENWKKAVASIPEVRRLMREANRIDQIMAYLKEADLAFPLNLMTIQIVNEGRDRRQWTVVGNGLLVLRGDDLRAEVTRVVHDGDRFFDFEKLEHLR